MHVAYWLQPLQRVFSCSAYFCLSHSVHIFRVSFALKAGTPQWNARASGKAYASQELPLVVVPFQRFHQFTESA